MPSQLSALLVQDRVVSFRQMDAAVRLQEQQGGHIGTCLLELDAIDEGILLYYASKQLRVPAVERGALAEIDPAAVAAWGRERAREHRAVAYGYEDGKLLLATATPIATEAIDAFKRDAQINVQQRIALELRIEEALHAAYGEPLDARFAALTERYPSEVAMRGDAIAPAGVAERATGSEPSANAALDGQLAGLTWSMPQWSGFVASSVDRDAMLLATLGFVGKFFDRRMLLVLSPTTVRGFALQMEGETRRPIARYETSVVAESTLARMHNGDSYFIGAAADAGLSGLFEHLGVAPPVDVIVMPIRVGKRAAIALVGDAGDKAINPKVLPIVALVARRLGAGLERLIRELKLRQSASLPAVHSEAPAHLSSTHARQPTAVQHAVSEEANRLLEQVQLPDGMPRTGTHAFTSRDWELPEAFGDDWPELQRAAAVHDDGIEDAAHHTAMLTPTGEVALQARDDAWDDADAIAEAIVSQRDAQITPVAGEAVVTTETPVEPLDARTMPASGKTRDLPTFEATGGYDAVPTDALPATPQPAATPRPAATLQPAATPQPATSERATPGPAGARPSGVHFARTEQVSGALPAVAPGTAAHRRPIDLDVELPGVLQDEPVAEPDERELAIAASTLSAPSEALVEWLDSEDERIRNAAFVELLNRGSAAFDAVLEAFPGPLRVERATSRRSTRVPLEEHGPLVYLCGLQVLSLRERLRALLLSDDANARYYAARLILQAADPEATPAMVSSLFDADAQVREVALTHVKTFLPMSDRGAILSDIRRRFAIADTWVVEAAAAAAAELLDTDAVPLLIETLNAESTHTRQRAASALSRITFQDFGANAKHWERWHRQSGAGSRIEWLLEAMVSKDWKVRDNAARELRHMPRLVVNYHPDLNRPALEAAVPIVERYLRGR